MLNFKIPKGFCLDTILSVQPTGNIEKVYDITTEDHEFVANGIVVHNCHQADRTLDGNLDQSLSGHGPGWQKWMRSIGLEPRQYDESDSLVYMDTNERLKEQLRRKSRAKPR
jgi:hypothetical protein